MRLRFELVDVFARVGYIYESNKPSNKLEPGPFNLDIFPLKGHMKGPQLEPFLCMKRLFPMMP